MNHFWEETQSRGGFPLSIVTSSRLAPSDKTKSPRIFENLTFASNCADFYFWFQPTQDNETVDCKTYEIFKKFFFRVLKSVRRWIFTLALCQSFFSGCDRDLLCRKRLLHTLKSYKTEAFLSCPWLEFRKILMLYSRGERMAKWRIQYNSSGWILFLWLQSVQFLAGYWHIIYDVYMMGNS